MKPVFQQNQVMNDHPLEVTENRMMGEWRAFLAAFHFLTIIPPFNQKPIKAQELGKSIAYYPIIGGLIGLSLIVVDRLFSLVFPISVAGALLIAFWAAISGGLHLDGFLDSCDGILGGIDPEDRLRIMKDERVGAFALIGGILLIMIKYAALSSLFEFRDQALLLSPIVSRCGMSLAIVCFPYGRPIGLGKDFKSFASWRQAIIALVLTIIAASILSGFSGFIIAVISSVFVLGIASFIVRRIPGLTGDSYGAINELVEVLVLLAFTAIPKIL
jgi:adenosylcobinamide-GDP ribazoletransferase